jgi:nucleoside-diphosphate-sugar epimerase
VARVAISGFTGFIGKHLMLDKTFSSNELMGVTRKHQAFPDNSSVRTCISPQIGSARSQNEFAESIKSFSPEVFVHLGADASFGNGKKYEESNVTNMRLLANIVKEASPDCHFIFASSVGAVDTPMKTSGFMDENCHPRPQSDYGKSKLKGESITKTIYWNNYTVLRLGMVYGFGMRPKSHLKLMKTFFSEYPILRLFANLIPGYMPVVHVSDVVQAVNICIKEQKSNHATYNVVASNARISDLIKNFSSGKAQIKTLDAKLRYQLPIGFMPITISTVLTPLFTFDSSSIKGIGWEPNVGLNNLLKEI